MQVSALTAELCSHYPADLECVLTYCDNATMTPNLTHNYAFTWDQGVIPLEQEVQYPCSPGMRIENDTDTKAQASDHAIVRCGDNGESSVHFHIEHDFKCKVDNLHCTYDGKPSEKSHGATNC